MNSLVAPRFIHRPPLNADLVRLYENHALSDAGLRDVVKHRVEVVNIGTVLHCEQDHNVSGPILCEHFSKIHRFIKF